MEWLTGLINGFLTAVVNAINGIIAALADWGESLANALLGSPFDFWQQALDSDILGYINWFIPVDWMIVTLEAWCLAVAIWYFIALLLRWLKFVE